MICFRDNVRCKCIFGSNTQVLLRFVKFFLNKIFLTGGLEYFFKFMQLRNKKVKIELCLSNNSYIFKEH